MCWSYTDRFFVKYPSARTSKISTPRMAISFMVHSLITSETSGNVNASSPPTVLPLAMEAIEGIVSKSLVMGDSAESRVQILGGWHIEFLDDLFLEGGWRRDFLTISCSSRTPNEYIIRALSFVGSRCMRGCRTLVLFKGAGFDVSAASAFLLCAILCGAFTGVETFILSPSVVIGAGATISLTRISANLFATRPKRRITGSKSDSLIQLALASVRAHDAGT